MNTVEIRTMTNILVYDLETIQYLQDYGRVKETVLIVEDVLARIQSFRGKANQGDVDFKDIFQEEFWGRNFQGEITMGDMLAKIKEISNQDKLVQEASLEDIKYLDFLSQLRFWVNSNILKLEKKLKSPQQKKVEKILAAFLGSMVGLVVGVVFVFIYYFWHCGLQASFYEGRNFEKYKYSRVDKTIDFRTQDENSSVRWQGRLIVPKSGVYGFSMVVDDGARLFIDGKKLIDHWNDNSSVLFQKKLFLTQGPHKIKIEYCNHLFSGILRLSWSFQDGESDVIPSWNLRPQ